MDQTKKLTPVLHQKWKYLAMWKKGTSLVKNSSQTLLNQETKQVKKGISRTKYT